MAITAEKGGDYNALRPAGLRDRDSGENANKSQPQPHKQL
jgi:hypothetical protein